MFVLVFTALSFIASCTEAPFVIVSNYQCRYNDASFYVLSCFLKLYLKKLRWVWGKLGCYVSGIDLIF